MTRRDARPAWQGRDAMGHTTGDARHHTASPIERLLPLLDGVRRTGEGRWIARCPAHDDRSPSLSIRETGDGTVLMKCWARCSAADVVAAVGMHLRDLFPRRTDYREPVRRELRWSPRDLLALTRREIHVVLVLADDMLEGIVPTGDELIRLTEAVTRLSEIAGEAAAVDATPSDDILYDVARALGRW